MKGPEVSTCFTFMGKSEKPVPPWIRNAWWNSREEVPAFGQATKIMDAADLVLVVGTSLQVYPAAGLVGLAPADAPIVVVDPHSPLEGGGRVEVLPLGAVEGLGQLEKRWASADPQAPSANA